VDEVLINANRSQARYRQLAPVIGDAQADFQGPLAGMLAGLTAARHDWVLFVPCDGPALPLDLMTRFRAAITPDTDLVVAHDGEHLQPVVALLRRALRPSLSQALADGERKTGAWFARHRMAVVPLPICPTPSSTSTARPNSPPGRRGCGKGARHEPPALLGFVAWSGTGKTTLLERLIPRLVARGLRLGVLKHTHHAFDMDQPGKDSHRLRQAGATQVMAASDRRHALIRETPEGAPFGRCWPASMRAPWICCWSRGSSTGAFPRWSCIAPPSAGPCSSPMILTSSPS
jgi:molybdenum cofactor guanylyltransferase